MSLEFGFNSYRRYANFQLSPNCGNAGPLEIPQQVLICSHRYKAGTKTFASWLVEAGKTCGETIDDIVNVPSAAARYSQRSKVNFPRFDKLAERTYKCLSRRKIRTIPVMWQSKVRTRFVFNTSSNLQKPFPPQQALKLWCQLV